MSISRSIHNFCVTILWLTPLLLTSNAINAQEICDNGIDDNGNGLIDLNDPECQCADGELVDLINEIPNPDFSVLNCPADQAVIHCADNWYQPSEGTPDLVQNCNVEHIILPKPPCEIPSGSTAAGIIDDHWEGTNHVDKEYLAVCSKSILQSGIDYTFSAEVGFLGDEDITFQSQPFFLTLFGAEGCGTTFEGSNCPTFNDDTTWVELGSVEVSGWNEWKSVQFQFTSPRDLSSIVIGPGCQLADTINYYFLDNIKLFKSDIDFESTIRIKSGHLCTGDQELVVDDLEGINYRWYHDGIAIADADQHLINALNPGRYEVRLTRDGGCFVTPPFILESQEGELIIFGDSTFCEFEENTIWIPAGYRDILWSTGDTSSLIEIPSPGHYEVHATDSNGCILQSEVRITAGEEINANITSENAFDSTSSDGSAEIHFTDDIPNVFIEWVPSNQVGNKAINLSPGLHCANIWADGYCPLTLCIEIETENDPLKVDYHKKNASCHGHSNGEINFVIEGGSGEYEILESASTTPIEGTQISGLAAGIHHFLITDSEGRQTEVSIEITEPSPIVIQTSILHANCKGSDSAVIEITNLSGGTGDLSIQWEDGSSAFTRTGLIAREYAITVTDTLGCTLIETFEIKENTKLSFNVETVNASCEEVSNGIIEVLDIKGGKEPYQVFINDQPSQFIQKNLKGNSHYSVKVMDATACESTQNVFIGMGSSPSVNLIKSKSLRPGEPFTLKSTPLLSNHQYLWYLDGQLVEECYECNDFLGFMPNANSLVELVVINSEGCQGQAATKLILSEKPRVFIPNAFSPNGDGVNDRFTFYPSNKPLIVNEFSIYDRQGSRIFHIRNLHLSETEEAPKWDGSYKGEKLQPGLYIYQLVIDYTDTNRGIFEGEVLLIR